MYTIMWFCPSVHERALLYVTARRTREILLTWYPVVFLVPAWELPVVAMVLRFLYKLMCSTTTLNICVKQPTYWFLLMLKLVLDNIVYQRWQRVKHHLRSMALLPFTYQCLESSFLGMTFRHISLSPCSAPVED